MTLLRYFRFLGQSLVILLITLLLTEGAFRIFHHLRPSFIFSSDSYQQFRPPPFSKDYGFRLNSLGFKDLEPDPSHDGPRIVALGDSFAYGVVPYDSNYLTLLDDMLDTEAHSVEVVNMGIPRLDVKDYQQVLEDEALGLDPDLVLVGFFVGNDFHIRSRNPPSRPWLVADFFRYLFLIWPKQTVGFHPTEYHDDRPTFLEEVYLELRAGAARQFLPSSRMVERNLSAIVSILGEMQQTCRQQDRGFLVTLLPDELQVDQNLQERIVARLGFEGHVAWEKPNTELAEALQKAGIPVLDLLPAFVEKGRVERLYKPRDTHWNRAGNRLAAATIARHLLDAPWSGKHATEPAPAR